MADPARKLELLLDNTKSSKETEAEPAYLDPERQNLRDDVNFIINAYQEMGECFAEASIQNWLKICDVSSGWPAYNVERHIRFLNRELKSWPIDTRPALASWVDSLLDGRKAPLIGCARKIELDKPISFAQFLNLFTSDNIGHIRLFDLSNMDFRPEHAGVLVSAYRLNKVSAHAVVDLRGCNIDLDALEILRENLGERAKFL